jgi:hypothetical protein
MCCCVELRADETIGGEGKRNQRDSELSQAVTTTMPARMMVAVIMVFFLLFKWLDFKRVGDAPSLVVAGKGGGQAVEEPRLPEGPVGPLE